MSSVFSAAVGCRGSECYPQRCHWIWACCCTTKGSLNADPLLCSWSSSWTNLWQKIFNICSLCLIISGSRNLQIHIYYRYILSPSLLLSTHCVLIACPRDHLSINASLNPVFMSYRSYHNYQFMSVYNMRCNYNLDKLKTCLFVIGFFLNCTYTQYRDGYISQSPSFKVIKQE